MSDNDDTRAVVDEGDDRATTEVGSCGAKADKGRAMAEVVVGEDGGSRLPRINVLSIGIMSLPSSNRCINFCLCKMYVAMVLIVRYCHALLLITSKCKD